MIRTISNAGGNWDAAGSWVEGVVPTSADDVVATGTSGSLTINVAASCRSINLTGYTATLTHNAAITLSIGDATAGAGNVALLFVSGMTYTKGDPATSAVTFLSSSATVQTIDSGGKTLGNIVFNGTGSWQLSTNLTTDPTSQITLTKGTFDTNSMTCSWGRFVSVNSNVRAMTMGSTVLTLTLTTQNAPGWDTRTTGNFTFNAGTSTINFPNARVGLLSDDLTFYNVNMTGYSQGMTSNLTLTFNNLTRTGTNNYDEAFSISTGNLVVNGTFTVTGFSTVHRITLSSSRFDHIVNIQAAAWSLTNIDFFDIDTTGSAGVWTGTSLGDGRNNTGITFDTPMPLYWVGNGGSFTDVASHWATSSNGTPGIAAGARIPLLQDTMVFDASSITIPGQTITDDLIWSPTIDFTNVLNNPTFTPLLISGHPIHLVGNLILKSGMSTLGTQTLDFNTGYTDTSITTNGVVVAFAITVDVYATAVFSNIFTFADTITCNSSIGLGTGNIQFNGNVTCTSLSQTGTLIRSFSWGSAIITLTGTGTVFNNATITNENFNAGTSTIVISDTSGTDKTFVGGGQIYNNISITTGGAGKVIFTGANTFNSAVVTGGSTKTIIFPSSVTTKFTNFGITGTVGNLITINSSTPGTRHNLYQALGNVSCDYLVLQDSNTVGGLSHWYAGANSTNNGNNAGWVFTVPVALRGFQITWVQG